MSKILITGGTGFAGSHLLEHLQQNPENEIHVTSFGSKNSLANNLLPSEQIHSLDLTDEEAVFSLFEKLKPERIYHLAAIAVVGSSFSQAREIITNNVKLQLNLLEAVKKYTPDSRVLVVGSAQEYDIRGKSILTENDALGPANPYGVSKVAQDLLGLSYSLSYDLQIIRVRPFNHIGERQAPGFVVSDFAKQIAELEKVGGGELKVGNLTAKRDFTDVKDIVRGYFVALEQGEVNEVYNLGTGKSYAVQALLDTLLSLSSAEITVRQDESLMRPLDAPEIIADTGKINSLGWQPELAIENTLERVLAYWREQL